jgi:hypothetical protein
MPPLRTKVSKAFLVARLEDLQPPTHLAPVISAAASGTIDHLIIVLTSPLFDNGHVNAKLTVPGGLGDPSAHGVDLGLDYGTSAPPGRNAAFSHIAQWDAVQRLLAYVYVQATGVAQAEGKVLMDVDVLLLGAAEGLPEGCEKDARVVFRVEGGEYVLFGFPPG